MRAKARNEIGTRGYVAMGVGAFVLVFVVVLGVNAQARDRVVGAVVDFFTGIRETVQGWIDSFRNEQERFEKSVTSSLPPGRSSQVACRPG